MTEVRFTVDGREAVAESGQLLLHALRENGAAPPGTIAPISSVAPPAWSSTSCRAVTSSGAS